MSTVVLPALDLITAEDRMTKVELYRNSGGEFSVTLTFASGESFTDVAMDPSVEQQTATWRERLVSHVQDFISESSFGWGQCRQPKNG